MPPIPNTDRINALERAVARLESTTDRLRKELDDAISREAKFAELDKSHSLLQQRFDESARRAESANKWLWGLAASLIAALFAAALALASGLIVALASK